MYQWIEHASSLRSRHFSILTDMNVNIVLKNFKMPFNGIKKIWRNRIYEQIVENTESSIYCFGKINIFLIKINTIWMLGFVAMINKKKIHSSEWTYFEEKKNILKGTYDRINEFELRISNTHKWMLHDITFLKRRKPTNISVKTTEDWNRLTKLCNWVNYVDFQFVSISKCDFDGSQMHWFKRFIFMLDFIVIYDFLTFLYIEMIGYLEF